MTFAELRNDFGSLINQVDNSGDFVSSFITTAEADRWLNQYYMETYKWYATANRKRFATTGYANTVEDQAVYTFGGDAVDLLATAWVGIKYEATDEKHRRAENLNQTKAFETGMEEWSKLKPVYFERTIYNETTGHYEIAIEFPERCVPEESVTKGIKVEYIERPPTMANDNDMPEKLPEELHAFIPSGAAIKGLKKMGEYQKAEQLMNWYDRSVLGFITQEQSLTSEKSKRIKMSNADLAKFYRYDE